MNDQNPAASPKNKWKFGLVLSCQLDDTFEFSPKGAYAQTFGEVKCEQVTEVQTVNSYTIDLKAKKLTIAETSYDLLELSATQLKIAMPTPPFGDGVSSIVWIFKH